jgi:rhodanese-related sulfurtransferase
MTKGKITEVGPLESFSLIRDRALDPDFVILDVRTAGEHEFARIEGSVNIDYHSATFEAELQKLDRKKTYLLYCLVGIRSREASKVMERLGFETVINITGGIREWHRRGLPVVGR